jgi:flagellar biosynthesis/type III secretory pathway chaperone
MKQASMQNNHIKNLLINIKTELNELYTLLNNEKDLLSRSDFENITKIADQKKQIITDIELYDARFKKIIKDVNNSQSDNTIHEFILKNNPDCTSLWIEIENLLKICKDKNSINGIILSNNRRQIQNRLAILQGQPNDILTYGATGESVLPSSTSNSPISV